MDEIRIRDLMNANPVIINKKASILDASKEMKAEKVGSIVIVERGLPIGIVTESDILRKIVAEDKNPGNITVEKVMSTPTITIDPKKSVVDAVKLMGKNNIRRLPVVERKKIIGIVTERDILQFSPFLENIIEEWSEITRKRLSYESNFQHVSGKCEECGMLTRQLTSSNGRLLCEFCLERTR